MKMSIKGKMSGCVKREQLLIMILSWLLIGKKNMVNRILIDTNVLLDYLLTREPFCEEAKKVILTRTERNTKGCIATHSISNMFFISSLNKSIHKHNKPNGLSTLRKTPLPIKIGAVFLYIFWTP